MSKFSTSHLFLSLDGGPGFLDRLNFLALDPRRRAYSLVVLTRSKSYLGSTKESSSKKQPRRHRGRSNTSTMNRSRRTTSP